MHFNPEEITNIRTHNLVVSIFRSLSDSDSLFDFHTPVTEDVFVSSGTAQIFRKKNQDHRLRKARLVGKRQAMNGEAPGFDYQTLFNVNARKIHQMTHYELTPSQPTSLPLKGTIQAINDLPFICLNNHGRVNELASHKIGKGDVIRLGKLYFQVLETHLTKDSSNDGPRPFSSGASFSLSSSGSSRTCRICLSQGEQGDGLISPCECRGSCEFVHFSCLQTWIKSKVRREESRMVSVYSLAKLECELCKKALPNRITIDGRVKSLVDFQWPNDPFIVLEKLAFENEVGKTFIVLTPNERGVKIGRWPGMDLRLQDATLSRTHSSISYQNGEFWLKDEGSKFGSLILLRGAIEVGKLMCLQVGSKVYKLEPQLVPSR